MTPVRARYDARMTRSQLLITTPLAGPGEHVVDADQDPCLALCGRIVARGDPWALWDPRVRPVSCLRCHHRALDRRVQERVAAEEQ
jgi:hypothetical protein